MATPITFGQSNRSLKQSKNCRIQYPTTKILPETVNNEIEQVATKNTKLEFWALLLVQFIWNHQSTVTIFTQSPLNFVTKPCRAFVHAFVPCNVGTKCKSVQKAAALPTAMTPWQLSIKRRFFPPSELLSQTEERVNRWSETTDQSGIINLLSGIRFTSQTTWRRSAARPWRSNSWFNLLFIQWSLGFSKGSFEAWRLTPAKRDD